MRDGMKKDGTDNNNNGDGDNKDVKPDDGNADSDKDNKDNKDSENEIIRLREANVLQQDRINKYDGERSGMSEKLNRLQETVETLMKGKDQPEAKGDEQNLDDEEPMTRADFRKYKDGEADRFRQNTSDTEKDFQDYAEAYNKELAKVSLETYSTSKEDTEIVNDISVIHDELVQAGKMDIQSTGSVNADARILWTKAENVYLKRNAKTVNTGFKDTITNSNLGIGGGNLDNHKDKKEKVMPAMSAEGQKLMAQLGMSGNKEFANRALSGE